MKNFLKFLTSKVFFINLAAAVGVAFLIIFGTYFWLKSYTNHGESVTVPDLSGQTVEEVVEYLKNKPLNFKVSDSTYVKDELATIILDQTPKPDTKVKEGRTIYLTINSSSAPKVKMSALNDLSLKAATLKLKSIGLVLGELEYKPDPAKNAVLKQKYKGEIVLAGTLIQKGDTIDLVLGNGIGQGKTQIPNLVGKSIDEAILTLDGNNLNLGVVINDDTVTDSSTATVFRQIPPYEEGEMVNYGELISLYLTQDYVPGMGIVVDSTKETP